MSKKIVILAAIMFLGSVAMAADNMQPVDNKQPASTSVLDKKTVYYPNANINSAISKYKKGNYTGCLQELFSLTKKDPSNALAYYYMGMAYTHVDMQADAIEAYEKAISLNPNSYIADYATKGRDCLTGGPACVPAGQAAENANEDELDKFINAPYGSGMSPELNDEVKAKQLNNFKDTINNKKELNNNDINKIREFDDKNKSSIEDGTKIAQVSDEEILQAVKTLREAGLTLSVQSENPYAQMMQYQDPRMAEMSMLLGNNNYYNNNSMMNMLPMLMTQAQKGENIDPRIMQSMLMNSMMPDFGNNRY